MTSLNVPNAITNGTVADATDVQQNFDAVETHVNTELVNRDGSIAMTGELLLPSNPTSNLAASTKSYVDGKDSAMDSRVATLEGKDIVVTLTGDVTGTGTITNLGDVSFVTTVVDDSHNHVVGNIDDFTENVQDVVGAMVSGNTESGISVTYDDVGNSLDFNVNDPTITLTGDVTGTATMTNLGNVSISATVVDDLHNHTIANVDGLQTALDSKQASGSYLTTSTTFGGDVSGAYNNIQVANSSHAHGAVTRIFVQAGTPSGAQTNDLWIDT